MAGTWRLLLGVITVMTGCGSSSSDVAHCPIRERTCSETLLVAGDERITLEIDLKPEPGLTDDELRARFLAELDAMDIRSDAIIATGRAVTLTTDRAGFAAICASPCVALAVESGPVCTT